MPHFKNQYHSYAEQIKKIPPNKPCASNESLHAQHLHRKVIRKTKLSLQKIGRVDLLSNLISIQSKNNKRGAIIKNDGFWLKVAS
jgi:hypothetical protein